MAEGTMVAVTALQARMKSPSWPLAHLVVRNSYTNVSRRNLPRILRHHHTTSEELDLEESERHGLAASGGNTPDSRDGTNGSVRKSDGGSVHDLRAGRSHQKRQRGVNFWTLPDDGRKLGCIDGRIGEGALAGANSGTLSGDTTHLTGMALQAGTELRGVAHSEYLYRVSQEGGLTSAQKLQCGNCGGSFGLFSIAANCDGTMFASGHRQHRKRGRMAGLFRLDPDAGQVEWIGRHRQEGVMLDLTIAGSQLFGLSFDNKLFKIATAGTWSGEAKRLGEIDGVSSWASGISFVDGVMYAIDYNEPSKLYTVDLDSRGGRCHATIVDHRKDTGLNLAHVLTSPQECALPSRE